MLVLVCLFPVVVFLLVFLNRAENNVWRNRVLLLYQVDTMDGHDFEYFCADLLRYDGFSDIIVTPRSGDQGADITARRNGLRYAVQCKRYNPNKRLSNKPVAEVLNGLGVHKCDRGIVLTNCYFTRGARVAAQANNVLLWDRDKLSKLVETKNKALQSNGSGGMAILRGWLRKPVVCLLAAILLLLVLFVIYQVSPLTEIAGIPVPKLNLSEVFPKPSSSYDTLSLGETAEFDGLRFTVSRCMFARHCGNLKYLDMAEDGKLNCAVYVDVENPGGKEAALRSPGPLYTATLLCGQKAYTSSFVQDDEFLEVYSAVPARSQLKNKVINFVVPMELQTDESPMAIRISSAKGKSVIWQIR